MKILHFPQMYKVDLMGYFEIGIYSVCVIFQCALKSHRKFSMVTCACDLSTCWGKKVEREIRSSWLSMDIFLLL